ncbi:MAG TPA: glycosyltransferase family 39 protein [Draconibacterium sp.]|nr:glycosyltransferase family 39 protein [Draconibacterium sp.]
MSISKKGAILVFFVLLKFVLQYFAINPVYELHRDEFLHLDLGKHLAWGYASVPPVTSWISFVILLPGNSVFWVKFFPALFGALTIVVVWKTIEELNGNLFALIMGSVSVIFSVLLRINTLYQPNSLEYLLWTVLFFIVIKFINSENNKWLWLAAVTFAIGFLNKYNIAFLMLGLLPALAISKHRKIFVNKHFYFSMLLALLIVSPNLIWQYKNGFPVFQHLKTLAETQLVNVNRLDFLKEQLMFFAGSLFVIILAFISFFRYPPFRPFRLFFLSTIFTLAIFTWLKAKGYYAIGLYPVLLAFGSVYLEKLLSRDWLKYLKPVAVLFPVLIMVPIFRIMMPVLSPSEIIQKKEIFQKFGLLRWEDGQNHHIPQDFADMLGWKELADIVDKTFETIDDKENTIIHCDNYGQAGAINFYSKQKYTQAVSMNADYINWYPLDEMEIKNVILVKSIYDKDKNREREKAFFDSVELIGEISNEFAREKGTKVYLLKGAKISVNDILREEIRKNKNNY